MIKAVIFDMDGLLIDTEPHWQEVERMVMAEVGVEITSEMQNATLGLRCDEQITYWYNLSPWENADFKSMERRYNEIMLDYFKDEAVMMSGAKEALDFFSKKGLPLALASSSTMDLINAFLEKFNLHHYFTEIVSAEFEKYGKPHPGVYLETALRLNVDPGSCLALEDSFHGMIAAKAAKMLTIAVPDKHLTDDPRFGASDIKLSSLTELTEEVFLQLNQS